MAVMSEFFEQLRLLTGALGYKVFEPLVASRVQSPSEQQGPQSESIANDASKQQFHIGDHRGIFLWH